MPRIPRDQPLLPTILDRLVDDGSSWEGRINVRGLKESVRRDLERLLNTRRRCIPWPDEYEDLELSMYSYGIPDFTGTNASSADDVHFFLRSIQETIRRFEPRFKSVRVTLIEDGEEEDRVLRFRIDGLLHAEPVPEPAVFDTEMEPGTGTFAVQSIG